MMIGTLSTMIPNLVFICSTVMCLALVGMAVPTKRDYMVLQQGTFVESKRVSKEDPFRCVLDRETLC